MTFLGAVLLGSVIGCGLVAESKTEEMKSAFDRVTKSCAASNAESLRKTWVAANYDTTVVAAERLAADYGESLIPVVEPVITGSDQEARRLALLILAKLHPSPRATELIEKCVIDSKAAPPEIAFLPVDVIRRILEDAARQRCVSQGVLHLLSLVGDQDTLSLLQSLGDDDTLSVDPDVAFLSCLLAQEPAARQSYRRQGVALWYFSTAWPDHFRVHEDNIRLKARLASNSDHVFDLDFLAMFWTVEPHWWRRNLCPLAIWTAAFKHQDESIPGLSAHIESNGWGDSVAVRAIGSIGTVTASQALVELLKPTTPDLNRQILFQIERLGHPDVLEELRRIGSNAAFSESDREQAMNAVIWLTRSQPEVDGK